MFICATACAEFGGTKGPYQGSGSDNLSAEYSALHVIYLYFFICIIENFNALH